MAGFRWRVVDGDFSVAANWANTTLKINPARVAPGLADDVTLDLAGGTISGKGSVAGLNISSGLSQPWIVSGQLSAVKTTVQAVVTIAGTGVLDAGQLNIGNIAAITVMNDGMLRSSSLDLGTAAGLTVNPRGRAVVGVSVGTDGAVTIDASATLTATGGQVVGDLIDSGTVSVVGGLTVTGDLRGSGTLALVAGDTIISGNLEIGTISFGAAFAALHVHSLLGKVQVTGFKAGDTIDIAVGSGFTLANLGNSTSLIAAGTTLNLGQAQGGTVFSAADDGSGGLQVSLVAVDGTAGVPPSPIVVPSPVNTPAAPPPIGTSDPSNSLDEPPVSVPTSAEPPTTPLVIPAAVSTSIGDPAVSTNQGAPLLRFFDQRSGGHFFTNSVDEVNALVAIRPDLKPEGTSFLTDDQSVAGTSKVFRFFDMRDGGHFYTASAAESDQLANTRPDMIFEGTAFYEQSAPKDGYAPVYRFFDTHDGGHLFTSSVSERDTLLATRLDLRPEGISFYTPSP